MKSFSIVDKWARTWNTYIVLIRPALFSATSLVRRYRRFDVL